MAKVTITLTDGEDGEVQVSMDFDPPLEGEGNATNAQVAAVKMAMSQLDGKDFEGEIEAVEHE